MEDRACIVIANRYDGEKVPEQLLAWEDGDCRTTDVDGRRRCTGWHSRTAKWRTIDLATRPDDLSEHGKLARREVCALALTLPQKRATQHSQRRKVSVFAMTLPQRLPRHHFTKLLTGVFRLAKLAWVHEYLGTATWVYLHVYLKIDFATTLRWIECWNASEDLNYLWFLGRWYQNLKLNFDGELRLTLMMMTPMSTHHLWLNWPLLTWWLRLLMVHLTPLTPTAIWPCSRDGTDCWWFIYLYTSSEKRSYRLFVIVIVLY